MPAITTVHTRLAVALLAFLRFPFSLSGLLLREFDQALRGESRLTSLFALRTEVLENTVLNDIVSSVRWCKPVAWSWCAAAHINIFGERLDFLRLLKEPVQVWA